MFGHFCDIHKERFDGTKIVLLEPVSLLPNTPEVLIPEQEKIYWQRLVRLGLIKHVRSLPTDESPFAPIRVTGAPVSQTIIDGRR